VTLRHAEAVEAFLAAAARRPGEIDVVGFHGQTVLHAPARRLTVQIGDGQALADRLGIAVVWDFRAADMAAGGEGAPLAPVFHQALAEAAGLEPPVAFLNLGGVANLTFIGSDGLIAFDSGPGNGLLDDWTMLRRGEAFDRDGMLAASGQPNESVVDELLRDPYFSRPPPKSLDRHNFSLAGLATLADADGAATLLSFSARSVAAGLAQLPSTPRAVYACGGGRRNPALMSAIAEAIGGTPLNPVEALGFDGDAIEAQAFAFLAVRALHGLPLSLPMTTNAPEPLTGGRISRPRASAGRDAPHASASAARRMSR
jgi:anhydro-N-acetylmuramic acid kinase